MIAGSLGTDAELRPHHRRVSLSDAPKDDDILDSVPDRPGDQVLGIVVRGRDELPGFGLDHFAQIDKVPIDPVIPRLDRQELVVRLL